AFRSLPSPSIFWATKIAAERRLMPPADKRVLLVIRLNSYWLWESFFFVWVLLTGFALGPLVSPLAVLLATPAAPPLASAVTDVVVSSFNVVLRATCPSGSNFS